MEQHPIPQQISSYEFKLVGEMTLKQFLKAAVGVVLAVAINATKLVFFIKYPLIFVFAGGGLALAFVPFDDRPLDSWIMAFIKAIYSPTIYTYKKKVNKNWMEIDLTKTEIVEVEESGEGEKTVKDKQKVREFIESLPSVKREKQKAAPEETKEDETVKKDVRTKVIVKPTEIAEEEEKTPEKVEADWRDKKAGLGLEAKKLRATGKVNFGSIPMPDIPEVPNLVVGMVTDSMGKIVEGAIVEILDINGNPSRVLKTNSLGQFRTATQLANGKYLVVPEKEGLNFDRVDIDLRGQIVQPVRVIANA